MKRFLNKSMVLLLTVMLALSALSVMTMAADENESDTPAAGTEGTAQTTLTAEDLGLSEERLKEMEADDPMYEKAMSQTAQSDAENDSGISTLSVMSTGQIRSYGIDVSAYQGKIDWKKVAAAGVSFAIIRIGYRGYGTGKLVQDDYAVQNIEGALANGIEVGCYFFSTSINEAEAREEAQFVINVIKNYNVTYPIAFDHEGYEDTKYRNYDIGSGSNDRRTAMSIAYNDYLEDHGYQGMQYGSSSRLSNNYRWNTTTLESKYQVWVANYRTWYTDSKGNGIQYPNYQTLIDDGRTLPYSGAYRFWQFSSQGQIDGISGNVDLDLEYYTTGSTESGKTGNSVNLADPSLFDGDVVNMEYEGEEGWWYTIDDEVQTDYTGVANHSNDYGWWYIKEGKVDFSYNGLAQNYYGWWYVENGKVIFAEDSVVKGSVNGTDGWYEVVGGQVQLDHTGVSNVCNKNGWWYVKNGKVDFSKNSVEQNNYGWWYVNDGKVNFSYTGVGNYSNNYGWWYIKDGKVDFSKTSVEQNRYGWWRVVDGKVDFSCNSVEQNDYGWWYILGGQVQFGYTGVANYTNDYGWWYINEGKVDFSYTGLAQNNYGWWYVGDGKVIFTENSVVEGSVNGTDGWYEVVGGQVQLNHTGVTNVCNENGWYYVKNGMVDFTKNSVEQNDYGWWYVEDGMVNFSYTGWASNSYGNWYCVNGKVDFSKS